MAVATLHTERRSALARRPAVQRAARGSLLQRCGADGCTCGGRCGGAGGTSTKARPPDLADAIDDVLAGQLSRAVATRAVQRAAADGAAGQLTSPRFMRVDGSPEPKLLACFEDRGRLDVGARDPASDEDVGPVAKVQQALIDLGFDLGTSGADGQYGARTSKAVKSFKATQRLGFEHLGDVGPGTMRRLDALFGPSLPVCQLDDDVAILGIRDSVGGARDRCNPRRQRDVKPGVCPPAQPGLGVCGPDVSSETELTWRGAQAQFKALPFRQKLDNCSMLVGPLIPDPAGGKFSFKLNADAFDTVGLFQGTADWTRGAPWHPPCGTPGSTGDPAEAFDDLHECDTVCSNTVQIGGECWLTGTVNYGLFGIAMRSCHDFFDGIDPTGASAVAFGLPAAMALAGGYKAVKGDNIVGPEKWVIAAWRGGPAATAKGANRPRCAPTCAGPAPPTFSVIWEPHIHPRAGPRPPRKP